ncbi:MAG: glycosyltransferase family 1 protein [Acidobacteriota bacterium]
MTAPLRVLVTADVVGKELTGVGVATRMIVDALRERPEVEVSVLVAGDSQARQWGVPVVEADWRVPGMPFVFTKHRKLKAFDVIHCSTVRVPFRGRPRGPVLVMTIHDLVPLVAPEYHTLGHRLYFRYLLARSLRKFDAVVTDSEATRNDLVQRLGVESSKINVIPLYSRWKIEPRERTRTEDFVLAVGTIEPRKNVGRVAQAFVKVRERNPDLRHRLVIAGAAGWGESQPFEVPQPLRGEIEWRGYVSDEELCSLYRDAAVLIYPSLLEGFGLPPLEAMSLGCPVITSDRSSLPEIGGDAVIYVDPTDVENLTGAIERMLCDGRLREELRQKGLERSRQFSPERMGEELSAVYRGVLGAGSDE